MKRLPSAILLRVLLSLAGVLWFAGPGLAQYGEITVQFSSPIYYVMENGGSMTIDVVLSASSSNTVTVKYGTADGTATAGADYTATSGTLTFAPGETSKTFAVPILPDTIVEDTEWFTVTLSEADKATVSPTQGTATVTITDDDVPPPMVFLSAASYSVPENSTMPIIEVKLSAPAYTTVTVPFTVTNGTAQEGTDFSFPPSPLTFLPGETSKMIGMTINDMEVEADESFSFALGQPDGAVLGTPSTTTVTITDDDSMPPFTVTASAASPSPNPVCLNGESKASLSATESNPPSGPGVSGPVWSWTITAVQYSSDGMTWGASPGGDYQYIWQDYATSAATLAGYFPAAGFWKITVQATATYSDSQANFWSASGLTQVTFQASGGGQSSTVQVSASASGPSGPVCIVHPVSANLGASVADPPAGANGPTWYWSVTAVQYSSDGTTWASSPGGDSETIAQPDPGLPEATLTAQFLQAGYWKITLQADVYYEDSPCTNTWSGSGSTTLIIQTTSEQNNPLTVSINVGSLPSSVWVGEAVTSNLTATSSSQPNSNPYWNWSVVSAKFRPTQTDPWVNADPSSLSLSIMSQQGGTVTGTVTFYQAGYYQVELKAAVGYADEQCNTWTGSETITLSLTAVGVVVSPDPIWVAVGGTESATPTVSPPEMVSSVSFAIADTTLATISGSGSPLTVTGIAEGYTVINALLEDKAQSVATVIVYNNACSGQ